MPKFSAWWGSHVIVLKNVDKDKHQREKRNRMSFFGAVFLFVLMRETWNQNDTYRVSIV